MDLWHVPTATRLRTFDGTLAIVRRLEFSPDGNTLAAASGDGTVLLWDVSPWRRRR